MVLTRHNIQYMHSQMKTASGQVVIRCNLKDQNQENQHFEWTDCCLPDSNITVYWTCKN